jgi:hypothetical protein
MFNCREVTRLVSESLDRELSLGQRIGIRIHFMMCKLCPEAKKQMLFLREAMHRLAMEDMASGPDGALSPEARHRIKLAVTRK